MLAQLPPFDPALLAGILAGTLAGMFLAFLALSTKERD